MKRNVLRIMSVAMCCSGLLLPFTACKSPASSKKGPTTEVTTQAPASSVTEEVGTLSGDTITPGEESTTARIEDSTLQSLPTGEPVTAGTTEGEETSGPDPHQGEWDPQP